MNTEHEKLQIEKIWCVSTGHITLEDNDKLEAGNSILSYDPIQYGYLIWVNEDEEILDDLKKQLEDDGFSPGLHALLTKANELGCRYIYLDRDGFLAPNLRVYDW